MHPAFISLFLRILLKVLSPLNLGSKEGWIFIIFLPKELIILEDIIFIYPARQIKEILYFFKLSKILLSQFLILVLIIA